MKKKLHNHLSTKILGALLALTSIINLTGAQAPEPTPQTQVIQAVTDTSQPQSTSADNELFVADSAWLNYISNAALVPPLPDHSDISTAPANPEMGSISLSLTLFKCRSFDDFFNAGINISNHNKAVPHAHKLLVNPNDEIYFGGDIHGSIGTLARLMWFWRNMGVLDQNFKIPDGKYLIFLGDYTDYGKQGISVLYTLINLKLLNWNRMILLSGNHENAQMAVAGGFLSELARQYGPGNGNNLLIAYHNDFFRLLPNVLYIGLDNQHSFIQCCHGGIEPGFNPKAFLESNATFFDLTNTFENYQFDDALMTVIEPDQTKRDGLKASLYERMEKAKIPLLISRTTDPQDPSKKQYRYINTTSSGFQWSDMMPGVPFGFNEIRGCGFVANKELMSQIGKACKICAYIRGHQHNLGVKIGDIEQNENAAKAHWFNIFGLKPQPQLIEFPFSTSPLAFNIAIPNMYQALTNIKQLLAQSTCNLEEYNNAWQTFKKTLPNFKFSAFTSCLPIITLSSASEAHGSGVYNPWDSFGLCTINAAIEHSDFAIYEAEACGPQQGLIAPQKRKLPEQQIPSPQNPTSPAKKKDIGTDDEKKV